MIPTLEKVNSICRSNKKFQTYKLGGGEGEGGVGQIVTITMRSFESLGPAILD